MSFYLRRYFFEKTGGKEQGKFRLTSPRGDRVLNGVKGYHHGIDLVGLDDTTVYSIVDGKVRTGSDNSAGNAVS